VGDDRFRIPADQLDEYSLRPDGAQLVTGQDPAPPPEPPKVVASVVPITGLVQREMVLTSDAARRHQRRWSRVPALVCLAVVLVSTLLLLAG
jgi:hypothetical protein